MKKIENKYEGWKTVARINKEEYQLLKELKNRDFKWLAKDRDKTLIASQSRPSKTDEMWRDERTRLCFNYKDSQLFQFIQWEDEEPYNIDELIQEYEEYLRTPVAPKFSIDGVEHLFENESEEVEVKKDMDWLNNELEKVIKAVESDDIYFAGKKDYDEGYIDGIRDVQSIVNQLDEPETVEQTALLLENVLKENKRLGKLLEEKHEEWLELMDEINNQENETLSQEWIDENVSFIQAGRGYVLGSRLKNLIMPKQELPVIPKFVADWIEKYREREANVWHLLNNVSIQKDCSLELWSWLWGENNVDVLARAWIDDYTVEEEPKYIIQIAERDFMVMDDEGVMYPVDINVHNYKYQFTEQEIKDYDPRYMTFAKPVEELEE